MQLLDVVNDMPDSDLYLLENSLHSDSQGKKKTMKINDALLQKTLVFMLNCTAIKKPTAAMHPYSVDGKASLREAVYVLSNHVISQRFEVAINNERTDVSNTVFDVLRGEHPKAMGVTVSDDLQGLYHSATGMQRQSLGNCLLTAISFYKLLLEPMETQSHFKE